VTDSFGSLSVESVTRTRRVDPATPQETATAASFLTGSLLSRAEWITGGQRLQPTDVSGGDQSDGVVSRIFCSLFCPLRSNSWWRFCPKPGEPPDSSQLDEPDAVDP
jgi:hypothetical protein